MQEFEALRARERAATEFLEYCGALAAWATFNVNRGKNTPFQQVTEFMLQRKARLSLAGQPATGNRTAHAHAQPAAAPAAPPTMRYARPGERPPSRFAPGSPDTVIERFDAYAARRRK